MIIDFHTHIFPDPIAKNTIKKLEQESNVKALTNGTLSGLYNAMKQDNIDYSVILPIVTKPSQFDSINAFAADINGTDGIFSLGSIHPENDNISEKLSYIKSLGLKGIKLHPDYQGQYIDHENYIDIIKECIKLDLCCVIHAGLDIGLPYPIHCPPDRIYVMLQEVLKDCNKDSKIVLAHLGGYLQWQLVEEFLVGQNVYFDVSFCKDKIENEQLIRIIKNHGSDRILFGTDSPWDRQKNMVEYIKSLPLDAEDLDNIFYQNAMRLLDI